MPGREPSDLRTIPGVGPSIEIDLRALGIAAVADLRDRNPDLLYDELCRQRGERIDPCVKYVFRCAVYFARNEVHDPALLQRWNWKDRPPQA